MSTEVQRSTLIHDIKVGGATRAATSRLCRSVPLRPALITLAVRLAIPRSNPLILPALRRSAPSARIKILDFRSLQTLRRQSLGTQNWKRACL